MIDADLWISIGNLGLYFNFGNDAIIKLVKQTGLYTIFKKIYNLNFTYTPALLIYILFIKFDKFSLMQQLNNTSILSKYDIVTKKM